MRLQVLWRTTVLVLAVFCVQSAKAGVYDIAKPALEKNIVRLNAGSFLSAGANQFRSFWTRDFCFSSRGLLAIGRQDVVKNQLNYLLSHRRADGLVPLYIDSMKPTDRVIAGVVLHALNLNPALPLTNGINAFYLVNNKYEAIDSNLMVLYAAKMYMNKTNDTVWFNQHLSAFRHVFNFYRSKINDSLIQQPEHADWQDSAKRQGKTFFTNLLYYQVARDYGFLSADDLLKLRNKIVEVFYDRRSGLFRSMAGRNNISLDGNLWAIEYNLIANTDILYRNLTHHALFNAYSLPGFATYPSYSDEDMYLQVKVVGLREYHGRLLWSWLMAYAAKIAYLKHDQANFQKIYSELERMINRDRTVFEIYNNDREKMPFSSMLYTSESPFSWGAAFVIDLEQTIRQ